MMQHLWAVLCCVYFRSITSFTSRAVCFQQQFVVVLLIPQRSRMSALLPLLQWLVMMMTMIRMQLYRQATPQHCAQCWNRFTSTLILRYRWFDSVVTTGGHDVIGCNCFAPWIFWCLHKHDTETDIYFIAVCVCTCKTNVARNIYFIAAFILFILHNLADSNLHIWIRKKTLELSLTPSLYHWGYSCSLTRHWQYFTQWWWWMIFDW